jgi:cytidine deaminase
MGMSVTAKNVDVYEKMVDMAVEQMEKAYSPYSHFRVGAALLTEDGRIYTGCNVENASYGATICAERTAFVKAVSEGERHFAAIAIAGGMNGEMTGTATPCGICRQVMSEFCGGDFTILLARPGGGYESHTLAELLPLAFNL